MSRGDIGVARFPIELDLGAPADNAHQVGIVTPLFPSSDFDNITAKIVPITGTGGKSKAVMVITGRELLQ